MSGLSRLVQLSGCYGDQIEQDEMGESIAHVREQRNVYGIFVEKTAERRPPE